MADNHPHINYTAQDIERYLNGRMTAGEMYALEKAAHEDPFLAEALEGYMNAPAPEVSTTISELRKKLGAEDSASTVVPLNSSKKWLSAAAVILLLIGMATTWYILRPTQTDNIAQKNETISATDSTPQPAINPAPAAADPASPQPGITAQSDTAVLPGVAFIKQEEKKTGGHQPATEVKDSAPLLTPEAEKDSSEIENVNKSRREEINSLDGFANISKPTGQEKEYNIRNRVDPPLPKTYIFQGIITDSNNKALPFVNIHIPTTKSNTYSDAKGNFRIVAGDSSILLHLKSLGFEDREIQLAGADGLVKIKMFQNSQSLNDVVVSGYGTRKQKKTADPADKETEEDETYAEPIDGWSTYDLYLQNNTRIKENAATGQQGTVDLSFTVNEYGAVYDFKVDLSSCNACDKEAIRLIKQGPRWKIYGPGKTTRVSLTLYF